MGENSARAKGRTLAFYPNFPGGPKIFAKKDLADLCSARSLDAANRYIVSVKVKIIHRFDHDVVVLGIDHKLAAEFPFVRDREFYLLINMPL